MAYTKTSWVARVGTALNRFLKANESSSSVELTADPTGVSTAGTPFTADNMNKIEQGIYDAHVTADENKSDINTIKDGGSLQGLSSGSAPTFASLNTGHGANELYPMNQAVRTTDSPTFAKLKLTTSTYGSQEIAGKGYWVVPVGIYTFCLFQGSIVQVWTGSSWVEDLSDTSHSVSGTIISDGSNVRIRSNTTSSRTCHYRKFS